MIERLQAIMARLRDPAGGCEWDRVQTSLSIAPYTIEEAYEVVDAITRGDTAAVKDELGDLLLQVVFHSRIAEEAGHFALNDVIAAISDKMERRHPHIFGDESQPIEWEAIKAAERAGSKASNTSALSDVTLGLPALMRADKLQRRAARTGFDWPDAAGPRAKIDEELAEIAGALSAEETEEELGDLLFSVVNWARHLGVDAEVALRRSNAKFERRFAAMEEAASDFATLSLTDKENLWQHVKRGGA